MKNDHGAVPHPSRRFLGLLVTLTVALAVAAPPLPVTGSAGPPAAVLRWRPLVEVVARDSGLPAPVLMALIEVESGGNPRARNATSGAAGLMQVHPVNWRRLALADPMDPTASVRAGARVLTEGLTLCDGDLPGALAVYGGYGACRANAYTRRVMERAGAYTGLVATVAPTMPRTGTGGLTLARTCDRMMGMKRAATVRTREAEAVPAVPTRSRLLLTLAWCWRCGLRAWWLCRQGEHPIARLVLARKWDTLDRLCDQIGDHTS